MVFDKGVGGGSAFQVVRVGHGNGDKGILAWHSRVLIPLSDGFSNLEHYSNSWLDEPPLALSGPLTVARIGRGFPP